MAEPVEIHDGVPVDHAQDEASPRWLDDTEAAAWRSYLQMTHLLQRELCLPDAGGEGEGERKLGGGPRGQPAAPRLDDQRRHRLSGVRVQLRAIQRWMSEPPTRLHGSYKDRLTLELG